MHQPLTCLTKYDSVCCLQPTIFFSHIKPASVSSHQPVNSTFFSQQISTSHQPQHSEQRHRTNSYYIGAQYKRKTAIVPVAKLHAQMYSALYLEVTVIIGVRLARPVPHVNIPKACASELSILEKTPNELIVSSTYKFRACL